MLKNFLPLIVVLIGVGYILQEDIAEDTITKGDSISVKVLKEEPKEKDIEEIKVVNISRDKINPNEIIHYEIKSLFEKANSLTTPESYKEALGIYNQIIEKLKDKKEVSLLKSFAGAYFFKAYLFKNYFQESRDAIEAYDVVIKRFGTSEDEELLTLYYNAQILKSDLLEDSESIEIYDEIINKFKDSDSIQLLTKFASAQFSKSHLLGGEDKIDVYNEIIDRFRDSDDKKLLKELSTAQFSKAYLLHDFFENREEAIDIYDEIVYKFQDYDDNSFKQEVTDALFAKSFLLMGEDNQESMQIFDKIIERCQSCEEGIPTRDFEYSVINNMELALIMNDDDTRYRELANEYLSGLDDTKPQLEMFTILREAQELNQDEAMKRWGEEHKNFQFENWSFEELKKWNNQMEDSERRDRIKRYLDEFIKHNNSISSMVTYDT
jgi:tetratricopeptide (TPR) repeat protein